jgi:hypothetical protein
VLGSSKREQLNESTLLVRQDWLLDFLNKRGLILPWSSFQQKIVHMGSFASG